MRNPFRAPHEPSAAGRAQRPPAPAPSYDRAIAAIDGVLRRASHIPPGLRQWDVINEALDQRIKLRAATRPHRPQGDNHG